MTLERDDIGAVAHRPVPHRDAPARAAVRAGPRRLRDLLRPGRAARGRARRSPRAATPTAWLRHLYEQWRAGRSRRRPRFRQLLAHGTGRARPDPPAGVSSPTSAPTRPRTRCARRAGGSSCISATIAGFGLDDCPGHPAWLEPGEWHGAARAAAYPLVLLANNPSARLHSQLDFGPHSAASKVAGREPLRMHPDDAAARGLADGRPRARVQRPRRLPRGPARRPPTCCRAWCRCRRAPGSRRSMTRAARRCCARRATSTCSPPTSARRACRRAARGPARSSRCSLRRAAPPRSAALPPRRPVERTATLCRPCRGALRYAPAMPAPACRCACVPCAAGQRRARTQRRRPHQAVSATGTAPIADQANTAA